MKLLNSGNTKTKKGEALGWVTYGIHLAPANASGYNVCQFASAGCRAACLNTAGRGQMPSVQKARINKTRFFFQDKRGFMDQLAKEVEGAIKSAERKNMKACFRLNLTSDLPWEAMRFYEGRQKSIVELFEGVQFYDYTKSAKRALQYTRGELPANYHLTFSRSESNEAQADLLQAAGVNVATVFRGRLPDTWEGFPVLDGDENDLRFLDRRRHVVGLIEKGLAKKDASGFVKEPAQ